MSQTMRNQPKVCLKLGLQQVAQLSLTNPPELKVQTSVLYDMVLERVSTQPFLTRDEIHTIIGNICSN